MNSFNNAIKHAHLTALRFSRFDAALFDLTPARVEMLRTVLRFGSDGISQATLRWCLRVTAPTVSIMVRALATLGFVERTPHPHDRRTWLIKLTPRAEHALRYIHWLTHVQSHWRLALACVISPLTGVPRKGWGKTVRKVRTILDRFTQHLGLEGGCNPWSHFEGEDEFYNADVPDNPITFDLIPVDWDDSDFEDDEPMLDILQDLQAQGLCQSDSDAI